MLLVWNFTRLRQRCPQFLPAGTGPTRQPAVVSCDPEAAAAMAPEQVWPDGRTGVWAAVLWVPGWNQALRVAKSTCGMKGW